MNDTTQYGTSQDPILIHSASCSGDEENLLRCMLNSETLGDTHATDAGVWCQLKRKTEIREHNMYSQKMRRQSFHIISIFFNH